MATLAIWHGYLLGGTGSNIYSANLVREWLDAGHQVVLMSQDPDPRRFEWAQSDRLEIVQPDLGDVLPSTFATVTRDLGPDRFPELDEAQIDAYIEANGNAMNELLSRLAVDGVLINHAVMGP